MCCRCWEMTGNNDTLDNDSSRTIELKNFCSYGILSLLYDQLFFLKLALPKVCRHVRVVKRDGAKTFWIIFLLLSTHCSKNSFFVQKFNSDFPRKLSIFLGWKTRENVVGFGFFSCWQLWFHAKNCRFFWVKNSRKSCDFGFFSCWQLWFHEQKCQKKFG